MKKSFNLPIIFFSICVCSKILAAPYQENQIIQAPEPQLMNRNLENNQQQENVMQNLVNHAAELSATVFNLEQQVTDLREGIARNNNIINQTNAVNRAYKQCHCSATVIHETPIACKDSINNLGNYSPETQACLHHCVVGGIAANACGLGIIVGLIL